MEMLWYIFGNWCCLAAAFMLLIEWKRQRDAREVWDVEGKNPFIASRDLQLMVFLASVLRCYWSLSPPPVWSEEPIWIQWLSIVDVLASPLVWGSVWFLVGFNQRRTKNEVCMPVFVRGPVLTLCALLVGVVGSMWLRDSVVTHQEAFPFAEVVVIWNMTLDGLAMIPQMYLIAYTNEKTSAASSHFIGLMCVGRLCRMIFWACVIWPHLKSGGPGSYIWTFIIPDLFHSVVMGDYLYLWLRRIRKDNIDPWMNSVSINV